MPTDFVCTVNTDGGGDFTSLAEWYSAMRDGPGAGTLVLWSKDPIVIPGVLTGTIPAWSTVTQVGTGVAAKLIRTNATYALLHHSNGNGGSNYLTGFNDTGAWQLDGSNYFTPNGPPDLAGLKVLCSGSVADASVINWSNLYGQGSMNPITIQGNLPDGSFVWDVTRFRWEFSSATGIIVPGGNNDNLVFTSLQVRNTNASTSADSICVYYGKRASVLFSKCLLRGGKNPVYVETGQGRHVFHNTAIYGGASVGSAVLSVSTNAPTILRNAVAIGGTYGVRTTGGASIAAENTYSSGTTASYSVTGAGTIEKNKAASSDATGSVGLQSIAYSTSTFNNVTSGSEDFGLPMGSPLAGVGSNLSVGRTRYFADVSSASEASGTGSAPVGILCFESGSSIAKFRLWDSVADKWFDGVDRKYNLSLSIPLANPSTTSDWIAMVSDTHFGREFKVTAGPGIDALNAGTKGRWNRATDGSWVNNDFPCTGRLLHLFNLGDIGPTDRNQYGLGVDVGGTWAQYQENLWNTSGLSTPPGNGCQSIPKNSTWHFTGNHDTTKAMASFCNTLNGASCRTDLPGFETFRLNQHGRSNSAYTGTTYADIDELHQHADIGNNRFILLNYFGSDVGNVSTGVSSYTNRWTPADTTWARWAMSSAPEGTNLFLMPHAPPGHSTRYARFDQPHDSLWEVTASMASWAASFCGHCHGFTTGTGPDWGCVASRQDYPSRTTWDIGAGLPYPFTPMKRPLRAGVGRNIRGVRV